MTYFTNFIKHGNPNSDKTNDWLAYTNTSKSYLPISTDLLTNKTKTVNNSHIRELLHQVWTLDDNDTCNMNHAKTYDPGNHTSGTQPALDNCLSELNKSDEYRYLGEHFLIEYEHCLKLLDNEEVTRFTIFITIFLLLIFWRRF